MDRWVKRHILAALRYLLRSVPLRLADAEHDEPVFALALEVLQADCRRDVVQLCFLPPAVRAPHQLRLNLRANQAARASLNSASWDGHTQSVHPAEEQQRADAAAAPHTHFIAELHQCAIAPRIPRIKFDGKFLPFDANVRYT